MKKVEHQNKMENLFLCDYFIADKDNKVSIVGIFDLIFATEKKFPFKYAGPFYLVGVVSGQSNSKHKMRVVVIDEDKNEIGSSESTEATYGNNGRTTFAHQFADMPITKFGKLYFRLEVDKEIIGETTLNVVKRT
jgi:hypothetical protein